MNSVLGAVAVNGLIYVIGGKNSDSYEVYDSLSNRWTVFKKMLGFKNSNWTQAFILDLQESNINPDNVSDYYSDVNYIP